MIALLPIAAFVTSTKPSPTAAKAAKVTPVAKSTASKATAAKRPWLNTSLTPEARAKALVKAMTTDEEIHQMLNDAPAIPRLGLPEYHWWSEALHGVATRPGNVTIFPQCIGLGATFDPALVHQMAIDISDEERARWNDEQRQGKWIWNQGLDAWAPNINIFRDPRWGRGQETYGEDPFLTGQFAISFVTGLQGPDPRHLKTISTPKHYAVHDGPDPLRYGWNVSITPRDMWLTFLPAFQDAMTYGNAWSIMSAYSAVNGVPDSANHYLLDKVLRDRWGFKGYVVSDCDAIACILENHHYTKTLAEAAAVSVKAGCDLDCGSSYNALTAALKQGLITRADLDKCVERLMEARVRLGMFDPKTKWDSIPMSVVNSAKHRALARKLGDEAIVLLKNKGKLLPLPRKPLTIAVVGPNADNPSSLMGNYHGDNSKLITVLQGIKNGAPAGSHILYQPACGIETLGLSQPIPASALKLVGSYFANETFQGEPAFSRHDSTINFNWAGAPKQGFPQTDFSVRWQGTLTAPKTGDYRIGMTSDDGMRVILNGKTILEDWTVHAPDSRSTSVHLEEGQVYPLTIEYFQEEGGAECRLFWSMPNDKAYAAALADAEKADVVVAVTGISPAQEGESHDRLTIDMPQVQVDMLKALKATGKPIVEVMLNGGPVTDVWSKQNIPAIVEAWYPGEEGGNSVADVLFGKVNPSGRLPVTVVKSMSDLPPIGDYSMKGRTYRFDPPTPLYKFGYGLSYTQFKVSQLKFPHQVTSGHDLHVSVKVTNTGSRTGTDVIELYLRHLKPSLPMPSLSLKAIGRVSLKPGQSKTVSLTVPARDLAVLHADTTYWDEAEPIRIWVGDGPPSGASRSAVVNQVGKSRQVFWPKAKH